MTDTQRRFGRMQNRDKFPCNEYPGGNCPRRKPGCHDSCEDFIRAKAENDARKQIERQKRHDRLDVSSYKVDTFTKPTRTKHKER